MILTVSFVLSPGTGLSCPVAREIIRLERLTPASGVSGPHEFVSVPLSLVWRHQHVHRIPHATFVTARPPLLTSAGYRETIMMF
jgi:hypothetical protein